MKSAVLIVLGSCSGLLSAQPYGLDRRDAVAPYFDGQLPASQATSEELVVVNAFPNLTFANPVGLLPEPRGRHLYVYTREGLVFRIDPSPTASEKTLFLDLSDRTQSWDDCGLLGMAFHPEFGEPGAAGAGYFYVFYQYSSRPTAGPERPPEATASYNRLSRFTVPKGATAADPDSELVLIDQYDQSVWHNGGAMFFHPDDGFLYLSLGDEGGADSRYGNAQLIDRDLFSGVIRIDVDQDPERSHPIRRRPRTGKTAHYYVPDDNPFLDPGGAILEEYWCVGLREPHRMTLDRPTGQIWVGDVGQGSREEIDIIVRGGNYQWPFREGTLAGPEGRPASLLGTDMDPVYDYPHTGESHGRQGDNCVIGGYVYRGAQHAGRIGSHYIFGDNGSGRIFALLPVEGGKPRVRQIAQMPPGSNYTGLSSFGVDHEDELYLCQMGPQGRIYRLAEPPPGSSPPPSRLSETGLFSSLETLAPAPGLIPYNVNTPLWSDDAVKHRWMAIPNDGPPYTADERIAWSADSPWSFPAGSVFVKHFELPVDTTNPSATRRLETRLLVADENGGVYGVTYKWREDQREADLLMDGLDEEIAVRVEGATKTRRWHYPSPRECLVCHTPLAGHVLGPNTHQLNGEFAYPETGRTDNQLRTLDSLELFDTDLDDVTLSELPRSVSLQDAGATLGDRVRSYLDANCAQCHQPGGVRANFDARYLTPLDRQRIVNGPVMDQLGISGAAVVTPNDPARSVLHARMVASDLDRMPPLGRNVVHAEAVRLMEAWIRTLPSTSPKAGLTVEYFDGIDLGTPVAVATDRRVSFDWGDGTPAAGLDPDSFSVRWTGQVEPRFTEEYTFSTESDDGVRLWVDGKLIIDNWTDHPPQVNRGAIDLEAGHLYPLQLEYYENGGGAVIRLSWSSPSEPMRVIPSSRLSTHLLDLPEFLPPSILEVVDLGNHLVLRINAETKGDYEVQFSTDLEAWETLGRREDVRGVFELEDRDALTASHRFYRLLGEP